MHSYLNLIKKVLDQGKWKENRTGIDCLTVPATHWEHNMEDGFPILTTKKIYFKSICIELNGFLQGITSKKWYETQGTKIWSNWANPHKVEHKIMEEWSKITNQDDLTPPTEEFRKKIQFEEDDLGSIYPHQLRHFGQIIDEDDNGVLEGVDQLSRIISTLKTNPNDRRLIVNYWNPLQLSRAALPPCHFAWVITHINGVLHLHWIQRSCDLMLGVPFNISSYGLLLELICKTVGMKPGQLSATFCDLHIYRNHLEGANEQIKRNPLPLPQIRITEPDIFKWTHNDVELIDYQHDHHIKMEVAV